MWPWASLVASTLVAARRSVTRAPASGLPAGSVMVPYRLPVDSWAPAGVADSSAPSRMPAATTANLDEKSIFIGIMEHSCVSGTTVYPPYREVHRGNQSLRPGCFLVPPQLRLVPVLPRFVPTGVARPTQSPRR